MSEKHPHKRAVVYPAAHDKYGRVAYSHLTFQQLDLESDYYAYGLEKAGIKQGTRTVLMVKPGIEFFTLTFAIFKVGAVPVVVDPGMGISRMLRCLEESRPNAFIGIPIAHALKKLRPKYFKTVKTCITVGRRWFREGLTLNDIRCKSNKPYNIAETRQNDTAAILFTTGSTGPGMGTSKQDNGSLICFDQEADIVQ